MTKAASSARSIQPSRPGRGPTFRDGGEVMSSRSLLSGAAWLAAALLTGCATGKSVFHEANPLNEDARLVRDVSEAPAGIGRELDKRPGEVYRVEPGDVLLVQPVEL